MIKTQFSIKDLENLSKVKAHTIRIWEKRYNLLEPQRTDTNIRRYDLDNLKKLLNVTFLYNEGYKISKIAGYNVDEIEKMVQNIAVNSKEEFAISSFKNAMFDFDHHLFSHAYKELEKEKTFREIFYEVFIPLLGEIGMLWQSGTIDPSHERFISELIKQKIIHNIIQVQEANTKKEAPAFALYLPQEEIHELGLLFANYELISAGYNTIYLGTNIPLNSLKHLQKHYSNITFLSYFTVKPDHESVYEYAHRFQKEICSDQPYSLWLMGAKVHDVVTSKLPENVKIFTSLNDLNAKLKRLK